jgi:hypothetical protein
MQADLGDAFAEIRGAWPQVSGLLRCASHNATAGERVLEGTLAVEGICNAR